MKTLSIIFIVIFTCYISYAQVPAVLRSDISVNQVMSLQGGAVRISYNLIDSSLYYSTLDGNIYKVTINGAGQGADTLVYSTTEHGITWMQGMQFYDSCIYVTGNLNNDSDFTTGIIMRGKITSGLSRQWDTVAYTVPYANAEYFNHLFSGMTLNPTGDTIIICSGSRGDHGEIATRNGLFPDVRNHALTSVILQIPSAAKNLVIPNDSGLLDAGGFVFARGIRNTFDFAYNANGELFGTENSCDRDMEDELNQLHQGLHYGYPWMMGSTYNPQQFASYDPVADSLINHQSSAWIHGLFTNDSTFPIIPSGLQFAMPCRNYGPDAAYMRDSITGNTYNAAAIGQSVYSFTPHRSPLGISFDADSILGSDFRGNCFVVSYTRGDTSYANPSKLLAPFNDSSEDLLLLKMEKDSLNNNYSFHAYKIVKGFNSPTDAILIDTSLYIIEIDYSGTQTMWRIDFPRFSNIPNSFTQTIPVNQVIAYPNPADNLLNLSFSETTAGHCSVIITDPQGRILLNKKAIDTATGCSINTSSLANGFYYWQTVVNSIKTSGHFIVIH